MAFNAKINRDGSYRAFHGWSVISMCNHDMKFLENFIRNNITLKKSFSPLPAHSYHVTVFNLWSNGCPLLKCQKDTLSQLIAKERKVMVEKSRIYSKYFNPKGCMDTLLYKLHSLCERQGWTTINLSIKKVLFNGNCIRIIFVNSTDFNRVNFLRDAISEVAGKKDNMRNYHMTLAYKFRDIPDTEITEINRNLNILNGLLMGQTITINNPDVHYFPNMMEFIPITSNNFPD